jgi:sulfonate transport system permease protein
MRHRTRNRWPRFICSLIGISLIPLVWLGAKWGFSVSDRFLPSIQSVGRAAFSLDPPIYYHAIATYLRTIVGLILGTVLGIGLGIGFWMSDLFRRLALPSCQALRTVPPIAAVPFFLLWFGFSEIGKVLLVLSTIALNLAVATYQALGAIDEKYLLAFRGFGRVPQEFPIGFALPFVLPGLLPTVRYSLAISIGAIIVSELLGSQIGLGYLIQTSRTTFSMHVVMLSTILLGLLTFCLDWAVQALWRRIVYWRSIDDYS